MSEMFTTSFRNLACVLFDGGCFYRLPQRDLVPQEVVEMLELPKLLRINHDRAMRESAAAPASSVGLPSRRPPSTGSVRVNASDLVRREKSIRHEQNVAARAAAQQAGRMGKKQKGK